VNELSQVTDVIVILLLGGLLAAMSRQQEQATHALELARAHDSVALRVAARIRASLDIDDVLHATVEEVGNAVGASRVRIRLGDVATTSMPLHEWRRRDLSVLAFTPPAPPIARVLATGEPVIVSDSGLADAELQAFVEGFSARALIVRPIFWGERVVAALGIFSDTPRVWESESELLDTIVPQIGAAIAQAEAYQHQVRIGRLRDELVANVSHELRTPLTATIGFLVTLERDDVSFSPERRRELLGIAREEAQRLARLVDDLLELTRFERGGVALVRGHVELRALAERVASTLDVPPDREIQVDFDEPLDVVADGDRLVQVLSNLVTNAVRHGAGPVGVHGRRENGEAVVAVWDDGEEIAASRAEEIFEPFARWSGRSDSTGLGLPIARRIMEAHGGSLSYRAPAHGRPHAFVMRLPQR
jgi:signal transduction histidine kinase